MATRILVWIICAGLFLGVSAAPTIPIEEFYKTHGEIVEEWGRCHVFLQKNETNNISPYGPGYWAEFLDCWELSGISDNFRKFEGQIQTIAKGVR